LALRQAATPGRFHLADAEDFAGIFSINIVATAGGSGIRQSSKTGSPYFPGEGK
jgi:hypothetical protein